MSEKKKLQRLNTPIGEALWAHVHQPKKPFDDKGAPKFQIDVVFDPKQPDWAAFTADIRKQLQDMPTQTDKRTGEQMKKQSPIKRELDTNDQPTGRLVASFKTSAQFKPGVFDKFGKPLLESMLIGNGSKVRVNYSPNVYDGFGAGINFYLNAVQVVELVEYQKQSASAYGFDSATPTPEEAAAVGAGDDNIPF
jgi:hypothetical protein